MVFGKVLVVEGSKATNEGGRQARGTMKNTKLPSEVLELGHKELNDPDVMVDDLSTVPDCFPAPQRHHCSFIDMCPCAW